MISGVELEGMSTKQLRELITTVEFKLMGKATGRTYSQSEKDLWNAICDIFPGYAKREGGMAAFIKDYGVTKFQSKSATLEELIDRATGYDPEIKRNTRMIIRGVMCKCFVDIYQFKEGYGPIYFLNNIDKLEHAVDQEFPGYIRAGILGKVAPIFRY